MGEADQNTKANVSSTPFDDPSSSNASENGANKDRILRRGDLARIIGL
jgi:hypothetical protein